MSEARFVWTLEEVHRYEGSDLVDVFAHKPTKQEVFWAAAAAGYSNPGWVDDSTSNSDDHFSWKSPGGGRWLLVKRWELK